MSSKLDNANIPCGFPPPARIQKLRERFRPRGRRCAVRGFVLERISDSESFLRLPISCPNYQAEWLPTSRHGTGEKVFINTCGGSCHGSKISFEPASTSRTGARSSKRMNYQERILDSLSEPGVYYDPATRLFSYKLRPSGDLGGGAGSRTPRAPAALPKIIASACEMAGVSPGARCSGPADENVRRRAGPPLAQSTEYELPWAAAIVHDVTGGQRREYLVSRSIEARSSEN